MPLGGEIRRKEFSIFSKGKRQGALFLETRPRTDSLMRVPFQIGDDRYVVLASRLDHHPKV